MPINEGERQFALSRNFDMTEGGLVVNIHVDSYQRAEQI